MRDQSYIAQNGSRRPGDPLLPQSYTGAVQALAHVSTRISRIAATRGLTTKADIDPVWETATRQTAGFAALLPVDTMPAVAVSLGACEPCAQHLGMAHDVSVTVIADEGRDRFGLSEDRATPGILQVADGQPVDGAALPAAIGVGYVDGRGVDGYGVLDFCTGPELLWLARRWGLGASGADLTDFLALQSAQSRAPNRNVVTGTGATPDPDSDVERTTRLTFALATTTDADTALLCVPALCVYATDPTSEG